VLQIKAYWYETGSAGGKGVTEEKWPGMKWINWEKQVREALGGSEVKEMREGNGEEVEEWANGVIGRLRPYAKGSYVNYMDPALEYWKEMYYQENYERLLAIKKAVDPGNFFKFDRSIS